MYMNKMMMSEEDQFEICGFFSIKSTASESTISECQLKQIKIKLAAASGIVNLFISGINLSKCADISSGKGFSM